MIIFDTETTGLIGNPEALLNEQPEIIEFAGIKLDDATLEEVGRFECLIKPRILPLPAKIVEITGITTDMLTGELSFARRVKQLADFFRGEATCVAHNCGFDIGMLVLEMRRLDYVTKFPWPSYHVDSVEAAREYTAKNRKLDTLHQTATEGKKVVKAHRAMPDVEALVTVVRWLRSEGRI